MTDQIRVLHVDDDPDFAELTATYLGRKSDPFDTEIETSVADALEYLRSEGWPVDCIVSDYDLPGTDGLEFLEIVREHDPDLPFILFTGKGSEEVASDALHGGATDYLQKQSGTEQYALLANRIRNAVEQRRTGRRAAELERIRTLVREVNQALVRASSVDDIETDVCELISDADPYLAACIADVDPETMHVEPRTWAGVGREFVEGFEMSVEDGSPGRQAPGGRAFHDREIAVSQNIREDPQYAEWRDAAMAHGFQSLAVVPIEYGDDRYGLLAIFASRPYAFDETEQDVLSELATDVAHAIHAQELRRELRRTNAEIERTNEEFSTVFERAENGLILIDHDDGTFRYRRFNRRMEEFSGLSTDDIRGKTPREALGEEDGARVETAYRECVERGEPVTYTARFDIAGEEVVRQGTVAPVISDGDCDAVEQLVAVVQDITEQRERERHLRATTARLEALFENSPDMIDVLDETGTIREVNARFCEELGYAEEELLGRDIWEIDQLVDADDIHELLSEFDVGDRLRFEGRYERRDGSAFPVEVHLLRLNLDDEDRFLAISRDITERKERERKRERIIDRVTDAIVTVDADWRFTFVDERAQEIYETDADQLLGEQFWDVFEEALGTRFETEYRSVMERREPTSFVEYYSELGGWFDVQVYPNDDGGISFYFRDVTDRVQREHELERYETLTDYLPVGVFRSTLDGTFVEVNDAFVELLGADSKEEVLAADARELYVDPEARQDLIERLEAGEVVTDEEIQISTLSGETIWISSTLALTEIGNDRYLEGISQEITERKERERELDRTRRRLEAILEHTTAPMFMKDDEGTYLLVNRGYRELFGLEDAEVVGRTDHEIHPPEMAEEVRKNDRYVLERGEPVEVEERITVDGRERLFLSLKVPIYETGDESRSDRPTAVFGLARDVTEQRERTREREATVEFLRRLYEITTDTDSGFDEKIDRLLDLGRETLDLSDGFLTRIETGEDSESGEQTIVRARGDHELLRAGASCPLSEAYCRKTIETDGLLAVADAVESGWREDPAYERFGLGCYIGGKVVVDGELYGTFCFASETPREEPFTDVERMFVRLMSKWASYELEHREATDELQRQNERLENFASVVSHNLRNPLNVADGWLEVAQEDCDSEHLEKATDALDRSQALIDDLLALAREGDQIGDVESVDLAELADRSWQTVETEDAALVVDTDRQLQADPSKLQQLLENLVRNAVEHGGPEVTVTVGSLADGFYVEDDGPGIPEDERAAVFGSGYSTTGEGTGLGLAIVEQIVDAHGWEISVTESAGGGTRFEITGAQDSPM